MELKADLLLDDQYLSFYTGEILKGLAAISEARIACRGKSRIEEVYGLTLPGLKDGRIRVESSSLPPGEFARVSVPRETTSIFADPHEVVNVAGKEGFDYTVEARKASHRAHIIVPSCVPVPPLRRWYHWRWE